MPTQEVYATTGQGVREEGGREGGREGPMPTQEVYMHHTYQSDYDD